MVAVPIGADVLRRFSTVRTGMLRSINNDISTVKESQMPHRSIIILILDAVFFTRVSSLEPAPIQAQVHTLE